MNHSPTLLAGWELGGGLGHLETLKPIILALAGMGWRVVLAARDTATANVCFRAAIEHHGTRLRVRQAPIFLHRSKPPPRPLNSLAEIMAHAGFADPNLLGPVVRAWERMIGELRPDVILTEAAPSLRIAAMGRVPVVTIGGGWTVPPDMSPVPPLPVFTDSGETAAASEARILAALASLGRSSKSFASILRGDRTFVACHPLLDPYRLSRREPVWWPPNVPMQRAPRVPDRRQLFVYLPRTHPSRPAAIEAAAVMPMKATGYFGGALPATAKAMTVSPTPIDLNARVGRFAAVVHHGGLGTATLCLLNRIPQLILPADLEKAITGAAIAREAAGVATSASATAVKIAGYIRQATGLFIAETCDFLPCADTTDAVREACAHYCA